jgi:hypothetical protein
MEESQGSSNSYWLLARPGKYQKQQALADRLDGPSPTPSLTVLTGGSWSIQSAWKMLKGGRISFCAQVSWRKVYTSHTSVLGFAFVRFRKKSIEAFL